MCAPTLVDLTNTTYWTADVGTLSYWTDAGLTTPIADPTQVGPGTYYISSDNLGCIASGSVTVTHNALPVIAGAVGTPISVCNATDGTIEVTLTSGPLSTGSLDWTGTASGSNNPTDITATNPDISGLGAGTYNITFTDDNGCVSNTVVVDLNNPGAPIIDPFVPNPVVACDSAQLPAITGTDLTAAVSWWTGPGATGTQMNVGDWITTTTTMYAYDSTNTVPTCWDEESLDFTISVTPTMTLQDTTDCSPALIDLTNTTFWTSDLGTLAYWSDAGLSVAIPDPTMVGAGTYYVEADNCLLYTSPSPRDATLSRMPSSA